MSDARSRGWGPGWPTDRTADMVWVRAPISGAKWQAHRGVAPILGYVIGEAERRGYLFDHGPRDTDDDWGYSNRPIRGTRTPSNHSWGLAVDIDAQQYPQGQRRRIPPGWLISLFSQWGFEWGGGWSYADPMHFEFTSTPQRAQQLIAMLAATHVAGRPVPVPPGTPSPQPSTSTSTSTTGSDLTERPMQIIHCPDAPAAAHVDPNTWWATDGTTAPQLAPGEPDHIVLMGLVPRPVRDAAGGLRPYPLPWAFFSRLRR